MAYSVKVIKTTHEVTELRARERIKLKDTTNAIKLDSAITSDEPIIVTPVDWAILEIDNPKVDGVYENYIVVDESGQKFVTGSKSFWESFKAIWDEMAQEGEVYQVEIYKVESKNYTGKKFITCSLL